MSELASESTSQGGGGTAELHARVRQFYAHQMALSEGGMVDRWAATFTENAVFEDSFTPEPLHGRAAIRDSVAEGIERIVLQGLDFRHWFGEFQLEAVADGGVLARYRALAMATPSGGRVAVQGHAVCQDHLVPQGDGWLVRRRSLQFDGMLSDQ